MAKTWYPVIDYQICNECGTCVAHCKHGVYDASKAPTPVVVSPVSCVDRCHGCGNRCPSGAIMYVGDDSGWFSPNGAIMQDVTECGNEDDYTKPKTVQVEYLYLDLNTCERCIGTDQELREVLLTLSPALALAGYAIEYRKVEMTTRELAMQHRFLTSPTIRVNGCDICATVAENDCGCCGEISGTQVDCRVFEYDGETFEVPPKAMLAESILSVVFGNQTEIQPQGGYTMPENLRSFYEGKRSKAECGCSGGNCCG
jgi:NAD-dependent dihydropyrimidine dehydrogenase PreA subunit